MTGADKLRKYLAREKLTHEQFAVVAKVPGPQVSMWLSERRRPGLVNAFKIEAATDGAVRATDWVRATPRRAA